MPAIGIDSTGATGFVDSARNARDVRLAQIAEEQARQEAEAAAAEQAAAEQAARDEALTITTPYYVIKLPDSWYGDSDYSYDIEKDIASNAKMSVGYLVRITKPGDTYSIFYVGCFSNDYGPEGEFTTPVKLGSPSERDDIFVCVYTPRVTKDGTSVSASTVKEYASYVSLR